MHIIHVFFDPLTLAISILILIYLSVFLFKKQTLDPLSHIYYLMLAFLEKLILAHFFQFYLFVS